MKIKISLVCLVLLASFKGSSQFITMNQGLSITQFTYKNDLGQDFQGLKSGSGINFSIAYSKINMIDSVSLKLNQSPFTIFLNQNPKLVKVLSLINYEVGLQANQFNAVGDIQNNFFSYQTDYLGILAKLGLRIPLFQKFSINLLGIASGNNIVHGNQMLMNRYIDLTHDAQFAQFKFIAGFGVEFEKKFSNRLLGLISYQQTQTINSNPIGQSTLNFKPTTYSVGIRFLN
jgi:hypothetical protein